MKAAGAAVLECADLSARTSIFKQAAMGDFAAAQQSNTKLGS